MPLKILFVLGLSLGLLAADDNLDERHEASGDWNETSVLVSLEGGNTSSHDRASSFSDDDPRRKTVHISSSTLPSSSRSFVSSQPEFVISTLVSTVQDNQKGTKEDSPSSIQHNADSRNLDVTLPNTTSEPKTTLKDITASKFVVHESSTGFFSKDSTTSLVTPVLRNVITQFESSDKELINDSSEIETPLDTFNSSENVRKIKIDATEKRFGSPEDTADYEIELSSMVVTTPKGQNEENLNLSISKRQNKSASIDNQQQEANVIPSSVTAATSTLSTTDTTASSTVSEFPDLPSNTLLNKGISIGTSENAASNNTNFKFKTEIDPELTFTTLANHQILYENSSKGADLDIIVIENKTAILKEEEGYTLTVPKSCSNYSVISRLLQLLNTAPNSKRTTNFECETLTNMKLIINSDTLMDKINEFLKAETKTEQMVSIKIQPNSTLAIDVFPKSPCGEGVYVPYFAIIIFANIMFIVILLLCCWLCFRRKCRRHSTSLDLHHIPRLNLKADYNLTPIPRPSISFPDGNRDFLHAYAPDNHIRSRQDSSTLSQRHSSTSMAKKYEVDDKEIGLKQEMQTFTVSSGRKNEFRSPATQDYGSPHTSSWDRLHENNYPKKYGVDNPGYRNW